MGRGKVQLKRIEDKISRQVTFSKRRSGLLKKAQEISVLCDAEVALIVFSTRGKIYEYSSDSSITRILERYERFSCAERDPSVTDLDSQESWCVEYKKLKFRFELLQKTQRRYMGEDLEPLSVKELQQLEHQLDSSLKHIRSRKTQLLLDSISELRKKGKSLQEQNEAIQKKLREKEAALNCLQSACSEQPQSRTVAFLFNSHPPTLDSGEYQTRNREAEESPHQHLQTQASSNNMPPWTLRLMTE